MIEKRFLECTLMLRNIFLIWKRYLKIIANENVANLLLYSLKGWINIDLEFKKNDQFVTFNRWIYYNRNKWIYIKFSS